LLTAASDDRVHGGLDFGQLMANRLLLAVVIVGVLIGSRSSTAAVRSELPREYLVSALVVAPHKTHFVVEIVNGEGRLVRLVQRTRSAGAVRWSPDGRMIAWLNSAGLSVENDDGSDQRLLVAASPPTSCGPVCVGMTFAWSKDSKAIVVGGAGRYTNRLVSVDVASGAETELAPVYRYTQYPVIRL
jgi:hypothetical protein